MLLTCIKNQDQDGALLQTVSGDMPMYPEARGFSLPGPYDVAVGSAIQDTSLTDELLSYYQSERGKTAISRNTRTPHYTPQHWLLCHIGIVLVRVRVRAMVSEIFLKATVS